MFLIIKHNEIECFCLEATNNTRGKKKSMRTFSRAHLTDSIMFRHLLEKRTTCTNYIYTYIIHVQQTFRRKD